MKRVLLIYFWACLVGSVHAESSVRPEVEAKLLYLIDQYTIRVGHSAPDPGIFLKYAAENNLSQADVYRVVERYAEDRYRKIEAETIETPEAWQNVHNFHRILVYIGETRDRRWIPFIRKVYAIPDKNIRTSIVLAYIDLMGADSIEFVENGFSNEDFEPRNHYMIDRKMQAQLKTADSEGRIKILGFFLRRMEKTTGTSRRKEVDQILANNFPEYRTSVQRKKYADWFLKSDFEFARKYGRDLLVEIEKVPAEQRKDLSELMKKPAGEARNE